VIVEIRHRHDGEDRDAADLEQEAAEVGLAALLGGPPLQDQRHDDVIRHHDGQRDAFHDHHRGGGGQAADEHDHTERCRARRDR